jgi:hypothetical protein
MRPGSTRRPARTRVLERHQLGFGAGDEFGGARRVTVVAGNAGDDDGAASVAERDVARGAPRGRHRHPRGVRLHETLERFGARLVAVQSGSEDVIKPLSHHDFHVVLGDHATVGDDTDRAHPEPLLQVLQHAGQGGHVSGLTAEHVMRDRDPVTGAQQPDHDLRAVTAAIAGVAESLRREPIRRPRRPFEVGRREVIADQPQIQVGEIAQRRVELRLGRLLGVGDGVERPVVLIRRRRHEPRRHHHVALHPLGQASLRARIDEPVGDHRPHRRLQHDRATVGAQLAEPHVQPELSPPRVGGGDRPERPCGVGIEFVGKHPRPLRMLLQGGDDAVQLTAGAQRARLAEAAQNAMPGAVAGADGLHQGQILVLLVAPLDPCRLHEHVSNDGRSTTQRGGYVVTTFSRRIGLSRDETPGHSLATPRHCPSTRQSRV